MTNIVTTESGEKFTLFFTIRSPFSNFHPCRFVISEDIGNGKPEERCYYSSEQYYMYHKSLFAGDNETAEQIANERDARKVKMMSRKIKNFEFETWSKVSSDVMRRGNFAKYTQNPILRQKLFYTYGSTLVECSPTDVEWGIGLDINEPDALNPSKWRGKNKLGYILTEIREELWPKPEYAQEVNDILSMLENFDTFSRHFFLPPKPRIQNSGRSSTGGNDVDYDKRRSPLLSAESDRGSDKRYNSPSNPCTERSDNKDEFSLRNHFNARSENDASLMNREWFSRSRPSITKRHQRHSSSYSRDRNRNSSSDDSKSCLRDNHRSVKWKRTCSKRRSQYDARTRSEKHYDSSESDHDYGRSSRKIRKSDDLAENNNSANCRRGHDRDMSRFHGEDSASSTDEVTDEEVKKALQDPFKSLLERLRKKQCGMWNNGVAECNNGTTSID